MATASAYDGYEDVGMAFSEDEVREYSPEDYGDKRIAELIGRYQLVLIKQNQIKVEKPQFWQQTAKWIHHAMGWYCRALELEYPDMEEIVEFTKHPPAGLRVQAINLDEDWLQEWREDCEASLRYAVTIGRRAGGVSKWPRKTRSASNKLANALVQEMNKSEQLLREYRSTKPAGSVVGT